MLISKRKEIIHSPSLGKEWKTSALSLTVRKGRRGQRKLVCILKYITSEQVFAIISRINNLHYRNLCFPCCSPSQLIDVPFRFSSLFSLHIKPDTLLNFTCLFSFKDKSKCTLLVSFMLACPYARGHTGTLYK